MNLKLCEKRFLVINSRFSCMFPLLYSTACMPCRGGGGGEGGGGVIGIPHSDLEVVLRDKE